MRELPKGGNEIILAVGNDWRYGKGPQEPSARGWAVKAHIHQIEGLDLR